MIMIRQPSLLRRGAAAAAKPFLHRRSSWKAAADSQQAPARLICWPGSAGWLLNDGKGSFKGWFDWLPDHLRVGPWHPTAFAFLFLFYAGLIVLRPPPAFPASAVRMGEPWWSNALEPAGCLGDVGSTLFMRLIILRLGGRSLCLTRWGRSVGLPCVSV